MHARTRLVLLGLIHAYLYLLGVSKKESLLLGFYAFIYVFKSIWVHILSYVACTVKIVFHYQELETCNINMLYKF